MRPWLIAFVLLVSCEGRCNPEDALKDVVPPEYECAHNAKTDRGVCIGPDGVFICRVYGLVNHTAICTHRSFMTERQ